MDLRLNTQTRRPANSSARAGNAQQSVELNKFCAVFENDALDNSRDVNRTRDSLNLYITQHIFMTGDLTAQVKDTRNMAGVDTIRIPPCRVLLVEDEEDDRIFSKSALENSGYVKEVTCFADGEELVRFMREQGFEDHSVTCATPTIIIIDIHLPRMSGFALLERLKADQFLEDIPVVILSGELNYESIRRALDLRADGVLRKPLNVEKVSEYLKHGWQSPGQGAWQP